MTLDYFYGAQADQFAFYRIPKALFTDERFKSISAEAKILYGILLDRMSLSRKNGWLDEQGRVFIIFTLEEVMEAIGCADQKATKLLNELDSKAGLIERKRQGLGKPNLIFVKNFVDNSDGSIPPAPESRIKTRENHDSADVNFTTPESRKSRGSNTDSNYTDLSETETYPFPSGQGGGHGQAPVDKMGRDMDEREQYRAILEDNLEYDILLENNPYDRDTIAEIMELLLDTICSKRQYIRIAGDDKPREVVKSQFLKLNCTHIEYVLSSFKENASKVRNIKQYLLASLYNAPLTISNYYDALVRHDKSQQYRLEDNILRHFPEQIEQNKGFIAGFQADMHTLIENPHPQDSFVGMVVRGDVLTDKENAGAALVDAMKEVKGLEPVPIGSYRGFQMSLTLEDFGKQYVLTLKGKMSHRVELGKDPRGNLIRIDNALAGMETRLARVQEKLDSLYAQMETAKAELGKPFPQEQELKEKSARLAQLNIELNIDDRTPIEAMSEVSDDEPEVYPAVSAKSERPSVLVKLHAPLPQRDSHPKQNETEKEVR